MPVQEHRQGSGKKLLWFGLGGLGGLSAETKNQKIKRFFPPDWKKDGIHAILL